MHGRAVMAVCAIALASPRDASAGLLRGRQDRSELGLGLRWARDDRQGVGREDHPRAMRATPRTT